MGKIKLTDISHIYPPEADKTLGYTTKPSDSTIISKSSSNYNNFLMAKINPPEADKTPGYGTKPFDSIEYQMLLLISTTIRQICCFPIRHKYQRFYCLQELRTLLLGSFYLKYYEVLVRGLL